ncbi:MAG: hypothetical protein M3O61_15405 [Gemmatimonadota bacterium]|nr:hypothetical protein [Gemmatimonadota bacterium]
MSFEKIERDYRSLLHPEELRSTLLYVSLYVLGYESFRAGVVDHVHMLYLRGFDERGWHFDEEKYEREILSRKRSAFWSSIDWFREMGALDDTDVASIHQLASTRNKLVHDLSKLIGTKDLDPNLQSFAELIRVYRKVETWRIRFVELPGDEDWDGREISDDDIVPGPILMMRMLADVALGNDEEAWAYYKYLEAQRPAEPS